jgi:KDO2-lipid IV(A) lauroyltransferase
MPKGPAALSLATGSDLIPAHVGYEPGGIVITFYPPVRTERIDRDDAIAELTQKCADAFAEGIAAAPEDWHMLQRIWLDEPVQAR